MTKYGIISRRSAASIFGAGWAWAQHNRKIMLFDTREAAQAQIDAWMRTMKSINVTYEVSEVPEEAL